MPYGKLNMEQEENIKTTQNFSLSFWLLVLFTISNYFSPLYYLGDGFARLPFILSVSAAVSYVFFRIAKGEKLLFSCPATFCLVLVYMCAVLSTYCFSIDVPHSKEYLDHFTKSVIIFILISHILGNPKEFKAYLIVLSCSTFAFAYKLVHYPVWNNARADISGGSSLIGDPNGLSAVFIYIIPITGALILIIRNRIFRLILFYFIFIFLLGIVEAQSRGAFIAFLVSLGVWLTQFDNPRRRRWTALAIIPLAILFTYRYVPQKYISRMKEIQTVEADSTGSAAHRANAMSIAFRYMISHPISEYGLGNHSYLIIKEYGISPFQSSDSDSKHDGIFRGQFLAHNLFLQFGADTGFIPLIFYLLFIFFLFHTLHHDQKTLAIINTLESKELIIISKALRISLWGFLVGAFFLPWAYRFYLFYLGGLIVIVHKLAKEQVLGPTVARVADSPESRSNEQVA